MRMGRGDLLSAHACTRTHRTPTSPASLCVISTCHLSRHCSLHSSACAAMIHKPTGCSRATGLLGAPRHSRWNSLGAVVCVLLWADVVVDSQRSSARAPGHLRENDQLRARGVVGAQLLKGSESPCGDLIVHASHACVDSITTTCVELVGPRNADVKSSVPVVIASPHGG